MPANAISPTTPETAAVFVSDVHLQESMPRTAQAFLDFLLHHASKARSLYLLGDLFEYWAGDDDLAAPFHRRIVDALRATGDAGAQLYWIAGNRDFLIGPEFSNAIGAVMLKDPHVTTIAGHKLVLAHGDAQCTDDTAYMAFRAQVRQPEWQRTFLALPLAQRKQIIDGMREGSREAQRAKSYEIMDVNQEAIVSLFADSGADIMIHGHTHRPARHEHRLEDKTLVRHVLPDWDWDGPVVRGGWVAICANGDIKRFSADGCEMS